jgi:hypothetical protein
MIDGNMSEGAIRERVVDKLQAGFANIEQMGLGGDEQFQREWEQHKTDVRHRTLYQRLSLTQSSGLQLHTASNLRAPEP